tara:strand:+ start:6653 stop:6934 length:282 start_codon:yes stop_codon:yes gene_type:complete
VKLSEVKTSLTVALIKSVQLSSQENSKNAEALSQMDKDITKQINIVSKFLGNEFLEKCMSDATDCLDDSKKFDVMMKKFKKVGAKFSSTIEEG